MKPQPLPDKLNRGDKLVSPMLRRFSIAVCSEKGKYRLRFGNGQLGNRKWTVEDLRNAGARLVTE